jgi:hypothetical protein
MKTKSEAFNERQRFHRELIRSKIKRYGFVVKDVSAVENGPNDEPAVCFIVTIVQRETDAARKFIEWLLKDYSYRIDFIEQMELALDKPSTNDKVPV